MSFKRILLPINGRDDIAAVGQMAFDVARKIGAEVEVLHPFTPYHDVIKSLAEGGSPGQIRSDIEKVQKRFEEENTKSQALYASLIEKNDDVTASFVELGGRTGDVISHRAFSSDLIVIGNSGSFDTPFWRDVYDSALFHSARPVLIAPNDPQGLDIAETFASELLVAWGDTAESARALASAAPFFATAKQVKILTISGDERMTEGARQMTEYARMHGANANTLIQKPSTKGIAQTLLEEARATPGTLLVMGAYSHARWRERVFGGVTEYVLHHADVPILMAH